MTDSPEEEAALDADARAYHADLPITEKINAFLEIQGIDLTTAFNHCSLGNFLIECRDRIEELEQTLLQEQERARHYQTALSNISKMSMCMATSYSDLAQKQKDLAIEALESK